MTVLELMYALKEHDPDMRVMIRGYEGGYDVVTTLDKHTVSFQPIG